MAGNGESTGQGIQFQRGDGETPESFVSILGIKSVSGPGMSRDIHDVTDMDSGTFREFIGGLVDAGEFSFEANFLPREETQNQSIGGFMREFRKNSCDSKRNWRIILPECEGEADAYWEFEGIVSGQDVDMPLDDVMSFNGTVKISGEPILYVDGQTSSV